MNLGVGGLNAAEGRVSGYKSVFGALCDNRTANASKALAALAVAERDIRALRTARADSARSDD